MAKLYNPNHVANAFLVAAKKDGINDVDPLKIQKLVYYLNGYNLAINDAPLIGEKFETWPYGPVLSSLYHQFKDNKNKKITSYAVDVTAEGQKAFVPLDSDSAFHELFTSVWNKYKSVSGLKLSALTHATGSPWSKALDRGDDYLDDNEIKKYFISILENNIDNGGR